MSDHHCPTPKVGAGHSKPPKGWQHGAVFACECGRLHALRNRWNYAGDWWEWIALEQANGRVT